MRLLVSGRSALRLLSLLNNTMTKRGRSESVRSGRLLIYMPLILVACVCSASSLALLAMKASLLHVARLAHAWCSGKRCVPQYDLLQNEQSPTILIAADEQRSVVEMKHAHRFLGAPPLSRSARPSEDPDVMPYSSNERSVS